MILSSLRGPTCNEERGFQLFVPQLTVQNVRSFPECSPFHFQFSQLRKYRHLWNKSVPERPRRLSWRLKVQPCCIITAAFITNSPRRRVLYSIFTPSIANYSLFYGLLFICPLYSVSSALSFSCIWLWNNWMFTAVLPRCLLCSAAGGRGLTRDRKHAEVLTLLILKRPYTQQGIPTMLLKWYLSLK